MADLKMCRVCLRQGVKLFHYKGFQLKLFYEELMNVEIVDEDKLPRYFCFVCAATLHKYHKFKVKCRWGQNTLLDVLRRGSISEKSIRKLNLRAKEFKSQFDIINTNERVRTFTIRSRGELKQVQEIKVEVSVDKLKREEQSGTDNSSGDENVEDTSNIERDELKDVLSLNAEEISLNNDKIDGDNKMTVVDEDGVSSSDDDVLSHLKNGNTLKKRASKGSQEVLKVNRAPRRTTKKKSVKSREAAGAERPKRGARTRLAPQHWERRQLSEQEAREEFAKRALSPKYRAAAFQCALCYRGFSQEDMLTRHNRKKHAEGSGGAECSFCRSRFRLQCELRRHLRQHYDLFKCLRCNLVCNLEMSAIFHEEHHNGVVKTCAHCGEQFTHTSTYYSHLRSHRSAFVCALCGQSFVSATGLRYHRTLKHAHAHAQPAQPDDDTYCERCDIRFGTREAFDQHYVHSAMHAAEAPGPGAEEGAAQAPALAQRLARARDKVLVRRPREPTTCQHCQTTFRTKRGFERHPCVAQRAPGAGGARGRGRGRGRGWVQLQPQRKPPQPAAKKEMCEICGATVGALYMRAHINTHTHQKVYKCDTCGAKTHSQSSHKRHQLTHTGEKPYPCPLCDKRFTQSNSMKLHYRTFHLKEPYPKRNRKKEDAVSLVEFSALQPWPTTG